VGKPSLQHVKGIEKKELPKCGLAFASKKRRQKREGLDAFRPENGRNRGGEAANPIHCRRKGKGRKDWRYPRGWHWNGGKKGGDEPLRLLAQGGKKEKKKKKGPICWNLVWNIKRRKRRESTRVAFLVRDREKKEKKQLVAPWGRGSKV